MYIKITRLCTKNLFIYILISPSSGDDLFLKLLTKVNLKKVHKVDRISLSQGVAGKEGVNFFRGGL